MSTSPEGEVEDGAKAKMQFYTDSEKAEKIEALTASLADMDTLDVSTSRVLDFLLSEALDRAENGEIEITTLEGSVNFRDLLDHDEE